MTRRSCGTEEVPDAQKRNDQGEPQNQEPPRSHRRQLVIAGGAPAFRADAQRSGDSFPAVWAVHEGHLRSLHWESRVTPTRSSRNPAEREGFEPSVRRRAERERMRVASGRAFRTRFLASMSRASGSSDEKPERFVDRIGASEKVEDLGIDEDLVLVATLQARIAVWPDAAREVYLGNFSKRLFGGPGISGGASTLLFHAWLPFVPR